MDAGLKVLNNEVTKVIQGIITIFINQLPTFNAARKVLSLLASECTTLVFS
jgi:hypothetical protein